MTTILGQCIFGTCRTLQNVLLDEVLLESKKRVSDFLKAHTVSGEDYRLE